MSGSLAVAGDPKATALAIMRATWGAIKYEKGATDVTTTAGEALALGRGVCQDFAHVMLSACRSQKIPARYVSGYLYNNGYSAASHAWVDVYIQGEGWLSLDPTHNCAQNAQYVRVAIGTMPMCPPRAAFSSGTPRKAWKSASRLTPFYKPAVVTMARLFRLPHTPTAGIRPPSPSRSSSGNKRFN